jgi:hypothetical protein
VEARTGVHEVHDLPRLSAPDLGQCLVDLVATLNVVRPGGG